MKRYHKKVYFPDNSKIKLKKFTDNVNLKKWQYTSHSLDNLKYRAYNIKDILLFIRGLQLDYNNIFEYYVNDKGEILKAVYRINYKNNFALCLVISENKSLVTLYVNSLDDNHITLNEKLYCKG